MLKVCLREIFDLKFKFECVNYVNLRYFLCVNIFVRVVNI